MHLLYVSVLFGVMHIGYLSVVDVVFVTCVGLLFAHIVRWGGSILGVTLAHGVTNATLFILMPYLTTQASEWARFPILLVMSAGTIVSVWGIIRCRASAVAPQAADRQATIGAAVPGAQAQ
jgi:uncharacterized membrane protein